MKHLRRWIYDGASWLQQVVSKPPHISDNNDRRWWYLSFSLEGTEKEANDLSEEISDLLCGNSECGHMDEICRRVMGIGLETFCGRPQRCVVFPVHEHSGRVVELDLE